MRITYISDAAYPSTQANSVQPIEMCSALAHMGHTVTLLGKKNANIDDKEINGIYGTSNNFHVVTCTPVSNKTNSLSISLALSRRAEQIPTDVYISRNASALLNVGSEYCPLVYEAHVPQPGKIEDLEHCLFLRKNFRLLIVTTDNLANYYKNKFSFLRQDRILIAPNSAPEKTLNPENMCLLIGAGFKIGYAGNLYKGRGFEQIISLADSMPDLHFHVAGALEHHTEGLKVADKPNLTMHGHLEHRYVPQFLNACDILIAPYASRVYTKDEYHETTDWASPIKLFEYMRASKPIVCSRSPFTQSVLTDNRNSLLAEPEDLQEWLSCLRRLVRDPQLRSYLGRNAYSDFKQRHTTDLRAIKILHAISSVGSIEGKAHI